MCPDLVIVDTISTPAFRNTPAGKAYWEGVAIAAEKIKEKIDREILDSIYKEAQYDRRRNQISNYGRTDQRD